MQKLSNIVFLSYYPEDSPVPLTPPPPTLPLYPLRLLEADAVISRAFNSLSHPLASPFFQKLSPSTFFFPGCNPCGSRYLLGGAAGDVKLGAEKGGAVTRVRMMEGRRVHMNERLRGAACNKVVFFIFFSLLFPKLTLLIFF